MAKHLRFDGGHTGATSAAGLCASAKISSSPVSLVPSAFCFGEALLTAPPRQRRQRINWPGGMPMFSLHILLGLSQQAQCRCHSHSLDGLRRKNGALLILRGPKREMKGEGGAEWDS